MAIRVYGTVWCGVTFAVRQYLMKARLTHEFRDIDRDPEANEFMLTASRGSRRFPIVAVEEEIITHPTLPELQRVLDAHRIQPEARRRRA
jgi:hypothetical protein